MNKRKGIDELTTILCRALRHKIGSILMKDEFYASKYARDYETLLNAARKVLDNFNFNKQDKAILREALKSKLKKELEEKDFNDKKKFEIMDAEMEKTLAELETS